MTEPDELTMETLLAEAGMSVAAGGPPCSWQPDNRLGPDGTEAIPDPDRQKQGSENVEAHDRELEKILETLTSELAIILTEFDDQRSAIVALEVLRKALIERGRLVDRSSDQEGSDRTTLMNLLKKHASSFVAARARLNSTGSSS